MTTAATNLAQIIKAEHATLTEFRRDLHAHPELGYNETRTSGAIVRELIALGITFKAGYAKGTGIVAHIPATTKNPGGCIAFRADIDALPIQETTGVDYASNNPGVMHACGHDGHAAMLVGLARTLVAIEHRPNPVTLIFQPAEEGGGGGKLMCEDGALEGENSDQNPGGLGPKVTRIFGLHNWPGMPLGTVATKPGPLLAATDEFNVTIAGNQGHAAFPHTTTDPIVAVCQIVGVLQTIASRNAPPTDPMVLSVTKVHSGFTHNVIPADATFGGTLRSVSDENRAMARGRFHDIVRAQAESFGCTAEIVWREGYPVTFNDAALSAHVLDTARGAPNFTEIIRLTEPYLGGEDFAYYGAHIPACFFVLGSCPEGETNPALLHQPHFDFNDAAIPLGIEMFALLALAESS